MRVSFNYKPHFKVTRPLKNKSLELHRVVAEELLSPAAAEEEAAAAWDEAESPSPSPVS